MYQLLKRIALGIIPAKFLFEHEETFRGMYMVFRSGKGHQCNVCHTEFDGFITLENGEQLCPKCGSMGRNRRLWDLLNKEVFPPQGKILHFSPSRSLYRRLSKAYPDLYVSSDFLNEFLADRQYDITAIDSADETYSTIICYHILEHIDEDRQAMRELHRVLKTGGSCYFQTPFKEGEIYEDASITSPEDRLQHFGQEDHVRFYSVDGLKERLEKTGFNVEIKHFLAEKENKFGYNKEEFVLKATKQSC